MNDKRILSKAYFEITNVCNLSCSFCPSNNRPPHFVTETEFESVLFKLRGRVEYLYFHLMGEPLIHPDINTFSLKAKDFGFKVMITSNGVLSVEKGISLIETGSVYKISLSLHSYNANKLNMSLSEYLEGCFLLAEKAREHKTICVFRLWNGGVEGAGNFNREVLRHIKLRFGDEFSTNRSGYRISDYIFLEWGDRFEWPGYAEEKSDIFCYALRSQIGILADGTVVPCCLDGDGSMALGNIYKDSLDAVLEGERAKELYDSFTKHKAITTECKRCGFARRFI